MPPGVAGRLAAAEVTPAARSHTALDTTLDRTLGTTLDTALDTRLDTSLDTTLDTSLDTALDTARSSAEASPASTPPPSSSSMASVRVGGVIPSTAREEDARARTSTKRRVETTPPIRGSPRGGPRVDPRGSPRGGGGDCGEQEKPRRAVPGIVILEDWEEQCVVTMEVQRPVVEAALTGAGHSERSQTKTATRTDSGTQNRTQNRAQSRTQNGTQNRAQSGVPPGRPRGSAGTGKEARGTCTEGKAADVTGHDRVVIKVKDVVEVFEDSKKVEHSERVLTNTVDFGPELGPNLTQSESETRGL